MTKRLTPCQAIKKYCKEKCCNGDMISWKECHKLIPNCPLLSYRFGKRGVSEPKQSKSIKKQADSSLNSSKAEPTKESTALIEESKK